ncbi:dehydrase and lipid transport-domain-containing protein [Podospora conica]|nr:dehydrase and lipid transport-domain-containing protein [Schizothecium conicum]
MRPPRPTLALRRPPRPAVVSRFSRAPPPQPQPPHHPKPRYHHQQTRPLSFLSSLLPTGPSNPEAHQTLHAHRRLPYPPALVHALIADVDSYRLFLPHCTASRVTRWVTPPRPQPSTQPGGGEGTPVAAAPRTLPHQADLTIGYGPLTQSYTSLVYSIPSPTTPCAAVPHPTPSLPGGGGGIVEAVSGAATTTIPPAVLRAWGYPPPVPLPATGIFESLVTRWTVSPSPSGDGGGEGAEVTLTIRYRFASAALGMAVGRVAEGMVEEMVGAFEGRAARGGGGLWM